LRIVRPCLLQRPKIVGGGCDDLGMTESSLALAHRALSDAVDALAAASDSSATADEVLSAVAMCEGVARRLDHVSVTRIADLTRRGTFGERGYRSPAAGLSDLTGWERGEAGRRVKVAEQIGIRVGLDGQALPPRLAATAEVFAAGTVSLRHVEVVVRELGSAAAGRLAPQVWTAAEHDIAEKATLYSPSELADYARTLVERLDQDGAGEDDEPPAHLNTLVLRPRADGSGGKLDADLDAVLFEAVATAIDAAAKPLTSDDTRAVTERQAQGLAEICGFALTHADSTVLPRTGGERPHLNVVIGLTDLEDRARGAMLDFGARLTPAQLRLLACDARVVPVVMNGAGQPLDVGRASRTIPDGLRRAVAVRDHGCAFAGCRRPPSWCEVHHIVEWEKGGATSLDNCVMLCRAHHRLMHQQEWSVRIRDGLPEFIPPRWIDIDQKPRRKPALFVKPALTPPAIAARRSPCGGHRPRAAARAW